MKKRCIACQGSGTQCGGGGFREDCSRCSGKGHISNDEEPAKAAQVVVDKRSKSYKEAIKKMISLGMSEADAHAEFAKG